MLFGKQTTALLVSALYSSKSSQNFATEALHHLCSPLISLQTLWISLRSLAVRRRCRRSSCCLVAEGWSPNLHCWTESGLSSARKQQRIDIQSNQIDDSSAGSKEFHPLRSSDLCGIVPKSDHTHLDWLLLR